MLQMFVLVCIGWVLFRAESLTDAWHVLGHLWPAGAADLPRPELAPLPVLWALVAGLWAAEWSARRWPAIEAAVADRALPRLATRYLMLVAILFTYVVMQGAVEQPFIYFQF
jgi:alginate O-acetyltransferase complex protein AlgI